MKLGKGMNVVHGVTNFETSISFYETLGLKKIDEGNSPTKFALYTDGIINLLISKDNKNHTGLVYFEDKQKDRVNKLEDDGFSFYWKSKDGIRQAMFEIIPGIFTINLSEYLYDDRLTPKGTSLVEYGKFGELAIPVTSFEKTETIFHKLGFNTLHKHQNPYPWGILYDGFIHIGLHQTNDFSKPSITYFAEDMKLQIEKLQSLGVVFEAFGSFSLNSGHAKVSTPDGHDFFFFTGKI